MKKVELNEIYVESKLDMQNKRYQKLAEEFEKLYKTKPTRFFSAPGRTEVGGNHTDHNGGCVMAASVSLDVIAAVIPTDDGIITVKSEGFPMDEIDTADLEINKEQFNTSASLIRGMAAGFVKNGHKVGGFKAYTTSNVLKGSGLSSSAAFEVLIGAILNGLYNDCTVSDVETAQLAQYAENVYFGKASGLMDQMASSVGSFISIDFGDKEKPVIKSVDFDFQTSGYSLCIVDTKGDHADLSGEYSAIPNEMKSVAAYFGKDNLRHTDKQALLDNINSVREKCGDRAVLRALHFFDDSNRAVSEAKALESGNFDEFLRLINESGNSSLAYLQNIFAVTDFNHQGLTLALYTAKSVLKNRGACRVHGGGFAGTIQGFVPNDLLDEFTEKTEAVFGKNSCYVLSIRSVGGTEVNF